jgi:hypothetical protein
MIDIKNYFMPAKKAKPEQHENEKSSSAGELHPQQIRSFVSQIPTSSCGDSVRSINDIKHQVILNYLWHKQRGSMWISDLSGQVEGVVVRKGRKDYLYRPHALESSVFAQAVTVLNVQVAKMLPPVVPGLIF